MIEDGITPWCESNERRLYARDGGRLDRDVEGSALSNGCDLERGDALFIKPSRERFVDEVDVRRVVDVIERIHLDELNLNGRLEALTILEGLKLRKRGQLGTVGMHGKPLNERRRRAACASLQVDMHPLLHTRSDGLLAM